jgi:transcriptional regulator with XRE-family HTH domain
MHGKEEKQAFAVRLRGALAQVGVRGPTQLALKFNLRYDGQPVSTQAAHKWLSGDAVPATDKIRTLAKWLGIDPHWLRYGAPEDMKQIAATHPEPRYDFSAEDVALLETFHRLDADKKRLVKVLLRALSQG